MCNKLKNVNIGACSDAELIDLRRQTLHAFNLHMQVTEELVRRCNNNENQTTIPDEIDTLTTTATANGRKLSQDKLSNINEDNFDIILDITMNSLRYRKDPVKHTKLKKSKLESIGPRRMEILSYLLEHPKRNISVENVSILTNQMDFISPNTLSKTIGLLRKALGQKGAKGPYIITEPSLGSIQHIYKLNPKMRYLVIKKNEKSEGNQRHGNRKVRQLI